MLPPSAVLFILARKYPVVSGTEIISEGAKHCRLSVERLGVSKCFSVGKVL